MRNGVESPQVVTSVRPALAGFAEPGTESSVIGIDDDDDELDSNGFDADGESNGHSDKS